MNQPTPLANKKLSISICVFVFSIILLALSLFISAQTYLNDDAVISYRYAWRLINGDGLVTWVGGPREEGFSNPLLVMLSAFGAGLFGVKSLEAVITAGVTLNYLATAALLFMLCFNLVTRSKSIVNWLSTLLLAVSYPLSSYLHSGLETPLYTFFLTATVFAFISDQPAWAIPASVGLATTRTEGIFLALFAWGAYFVKILAQTRRNRQNKIGFKKPMNIKGSESLDTQIITKFFAVFLGLYLLFSLCRFLYFGHIFPNPVLIKSPFFKEGKTFLNGVDYLLNNFKSHPSFTIVFALCLIEMFRPPKIIYYLPGLAVIFAQLCFILAVGGDEFHLGTFRLLLPILPLLIWGAMTLISRIESPGRIAGVFLVILLLNIPYYNALSGTWDFRNRCFFMKLYSDPIKTLKTNWTRWTNPSVWIDAEAGKLMAKLTPNQGRGLSMASVQAGSLPVYWHGEFLDLIGLTTRKMALAGDNQSRNEIFKNNPPDIVMAFKWAGGWFPVPNAQTMIDLGYQPFMVIQLKEILENGLYVSELPINYLVLVRDLRIFKNLAEETFDAQVAASFDDDTGVLAKEVLLKIIPINRGIPRD